MVAFRMERSKGITQVAQACKELGYKFLLVGRPSKPEYMENVLFIGEENLELHQEVDEAELKELYRDTAIHVCNSEDNFESGTLPILEAMASGVPVLTRNIGLVPDIYDGENMVVRAGKKDDVEDLKMEIKNLMEDRERRLKIREAGWNTVKGLNSWRMAKMYAQLYTEVLHPLNPLVSVITATYDRKQQVSEIVEALKKQTHKNIEFVVCDDNSTDGTEELVKELRKEVKFPIKYISTKQEGYNLAMARNLGVIEADGEFLMFLDSRLSPEPNAIEEFIRGLCGEEFDVEADSGDRKIWTFGDKGHGKRSFVENFSCIRRNLFIRGGMFNERINRYGGMSQELRSRFQAQGFKLVYVEEAKAKEILRAQKMSKKRKDITEMKNLLWKMNLQS